MKTVPENLWEHIVVDEKIYLVNDKKKNNLTIKLLAYRQA